MSWVVSDLGFGPCVKCSTTNSLIGFGGPVSVAASKDYVASVYVGSVGATVPLTLKLAWFNSSNVLISAVTATTTAALAADGTPTSRISVTGTAPTGAMTAKITLQSPATFASGGYSIAMKPKFEIGTVPSVFTDDAPTAISLASGLVLDVDVTTTAPEDGQALIWSAAQSKWLRGTARSAVHAPLSDGNASAPSLMFDDLGQVIMTPIT